METLPHLSFSGNFSLWADAETVRRGFTTASIYFPELATVFYPSWHVSVRSHDSEMLCNYCCKIWRCTCSMSAPATRQHSSIIDTKARLMAQLTWRPDAHIAAYRTYDPTDGSRWEESEKDQKHQPILLALVAILHQQHWVMVYRLSEHREEKSWRRSGGGNASGSHFVRQPGIRQRFRLLQCDLNVINAFKSSIFRTSPPPPIFHQHPLSSLFL